MPSVTRKPQAKRQERREQLERRLLDATERLMRDGASFTELSVDRLSSEAGMSRASFYIYFEDKGPSCAAWPARCSPISPTAPNAGGTWRGDTIQTTPAPGWPASSPATADINRYSSR